VLTDKGDIQGDEVVIATGSWLSGILKDLEIDVLLQAGKGYSMTFENMSQNLQYPSILVDDRVAMTPLGNALRMGGTMEISGIGSKMLIKRVQSIYKAAKNYFPDLPINFPTTDKVWHGLRPLSPDGLPYIGRHSKYDNLVIAGGHGMLGISLAAASGKLIDEIVSGHQLSMSIDAFSIER
jgi:D-amino-acid dehydrogenase